jgi:hypothetical protein
MVASEVGAVAGRGEPVLIHVTSESSAVAHVAGIQRDFHREGAKDGNSKARRVPADSGRLTAFQVSVLGVFAVKLHGSVRMDGA